MLRNPFSKTIHDHRVALIAWAVVFMLLTTMYTAFYPVMKNGAMQDAVKGYPPELRGALGLDDLTTGPGFLKATVFSLVVPAVLIVFAVSAGSWVIGVDEEGGTLDLALAQPVSRRSLLSQRTGAVAIMLLLMSILVGFAILATGPMVHLHAPAGGTSAACLHLFSLALFFASLTILVTGVTGQKGLAQAGAGAVAVITYLLSSFVSSLPHLGFVRVLSPFHYYSGGDPLAHGVQWAALLTLLGLTALLLAVAVVAFERRDVRSV